MIGIKKVQVTSLENYGKIIDSFNTTDDKTTNAPSINAVEDYVENIENALETEINTKQNQVLSGISAPTTNLGIDGDIYLQYEE